MAKSALFLAIVLASTAAAQEVRYVPGRPVSAVTSARSSTRAVAARNPHGEIAIACEACHTANAWVPLRETLDFDHSTQTDFPLAGRHVQTDCASCHLSLRFDQPDAGPEDCASCHLDVHSGDLGQTCSTCHGTTDFSLVNGEAVHARTAFPLTGSHLQVDCATCHASGAGGALGAPFGALPNDCASCHSDDFARTAGGPVDHVASGFPSDCESCHTTVAFAGSPFDHAATSGGFELVGAHMPLPCSACHTSNLEPLFSATSQDDCLSCHAEDRAASAVDHTSLPETCSQCHTVNTWEGATADHELLSGGFPLVGAHLTLQCETCHSEPNNGLPWVPASSEDCQSCHTDDASAATPSHANFPSTCATCHTTTVWSGAIVDHPAVSNGFNLVGAHNVVECSACHSNPDYTLPWTPAGQDDCQSCHADDASAATPSHANFPSTCATCHTTTVWSGAIVDHPAVSNGFNLVGAHNVVECSACHSNPDYSLPWTPAGQDDCQSCHAGDASSATPSHADFPSTCATCHTTTVWSGAIVDHPAVSGGFNLVGAHNVVECSACHSNPDYTLPWTPAGQDDCQSCHAEDASAATPSHTDFPSTCATCHTTTVWGGAIVDHPAVSGGFNLVGAHNVVECSACHSNPDYSLPWTPAGQDDCLTCHADDAANAMQSHVSFPGQCQTCHNADQWTNPVVDHGPMSGGFDLVGSHLSLPCTACHVAPNNTIPWSPATQDDCVSCHAEDASSATPSHVGFPSTCSTCHNTNGWPGATVDHPAVSGGFNLVGSHATIACETCHSNPDFSLPWTPANQDDCQSCHAEDAAGATPSHANFPSTCQTCHTTTSWPGAVVDHPAVSGGFGLVGAHATAACTSCHSNPDYSLPWTPANQDDCFSCHATQYQAEHAGTGFPETCLTCHTNTTWAGATFNHTGFPIFGGARHQQGDEWNTCADCHTTPGNFVAFSCIDCHEHRQSSMDDKHSGVNGYVWASPACYNCHPNGRNDNLGFELTGER